MTFDDLHIKPDEIYEQMGYHGNVPDNDTLREMMETIREARALLRPRFTFFIANGELNTEENILSIRIGEDILMPTPNTQHPIPAPVDFSVGQIITRQLRGSAAYAFFIATAGMEYEHFLHRLKDSGDMVRLFIADSLGSVIAEKAADQMELALQQSIAHRGWKHTNRFSPGYCGWHVSQQQLLFPLFGKDGTCGVTLSPSSLMTPIKSVSGVIGLGENVRKLEYTCGLCSLESCYKRRRKG